MTVRVADADWPPAVAVMTAAVLVKTPFVTIVNVAVVAPAATVTKMGTLAAALPLTSSTSAPVAGAACERVTVPVLVKPPRTVVGLTVRLKGATVFTWVPSA